MAMYLLPRVDDRLGHGLVELCCLVKPGHHPSIVQRAVYHGQMRADGHQASMHARECGSPVAVSDNYLLIQEKVAFDDPGPRTVCHGHPGADGRIMMGSQYSFEMVPIDSSAGKLQSELDVMMLEIISGPSPLRGQIVRIDDVKPAAVFAGPVIWRAKGYTYEEFITIRRGPGTHVLVPVARRQPFHGPASLREKKLVMGGEVVRNAEDELVWQLENRTFGDCRGRAGEEPVVPDVQ
ncbi:hypothetical protein MKX08_000810 [Trichoderma sp. CBMAI-0020]|nr:hypothetical protein MKX08_000810 [Trichoderma sp. CBMAI-0020]WOD46426.1 hypothetical protein [Trichoderma atroviride]